MDPTVSAQVSLYPLRETRLGPAIERFQRMLEEAGLAVHPGPMSTVVSGEAHAVFAALERAYAAAAETGGVVMCVTVSNACPV